MRTENKFNPFTKINFLNLILLLNFVFINGLLSNSTIQKYILDEKELVTGIKMLKFLYNLLKIHTIFSQDIIFFLSTPSTNTKFLQITIKIKFAEFTKIFYITLPWKLQNSFLH